MIEINSSAGKTVIKDGSKIKGISLSDYRSTFFIKKWVIQCTTTQDGSSTNFTIRMLKEKEAHIIYEGLKNASEGTNIKSNSHIVDTNQE